MRHLVLSDVHANLPALEAVLARAAALGYDQVLGLGDFVGYGAQPNETVARLAALPGFTPIRGNHDRAAIGRDDCEGFNDAAKLAAFWTRDHLDGAAHAFLAALPRGPRPLARGRLLSHGSPLDEDRYLLDPGRARPSFEDADFDLCFFGHTHLQGGYVMKEDKVEGLPAGGDGTKVSLQPGHRYLVNPGSVGQPRDRDPRAAFAIYDDARATVEYGRVAYPIETARAAILAAGLPRWLGDRLLAGV